MRIIRTVLVFVVLASPAMAAGAHDYLCIADMATGFKFDPSTKQWQAVQFNVSKGRYIVKLVGKGATWKQFGSPLPPRQCTVFSEVGATSCSTNLTLVTFNRVNLRFQVVYLPGWIDGDLPPPKSFKSNRTLSRTWGLLTGQSSDTPYIEIGRCSAL